MEKKALLVIDVQNDFLPGGALAVPQGDAILPAVNNLINHFDHVILTQDWHPKIIVALLPAILKRSPMIPLILTMVRKYFGLIIAYKEPKEQSFIHLSEWKRLNLSLEKAIIKIWIAILPFLKMIKKTPTGLQVYLKEHGFTKLVMCGLATDFCVGFSALHAIQCGFKVSVSLNACAGIDVNRSLNTMLKTMNEAGVELLMVS